MEQVIQVRNLYKLYKVGDETVRALDGVDFDIHHGEFCAIVGTSGSGKSTLLNMLQGWKSPRRVPSLSEASILRILKRVSWLLFGEIM